MPAPSVATIAAAYRCTRQNVARVSARLGLTIDDWQNPETIFSALLDHGNYSPLREYLSNPLSRDWIRHQLLLNSQPENSNS